MPIEDTPPEIQFLQSPFGGALVVIVALAAFAMTLIWGRRPGYPDRMTAVYAATFTSVLVAAITIVAVAAGWWQGTFLAIPLQMQRNQFTLGNGYTVLTDALVGQVVMLSPVLAYEAIRRRPGQR